MGGFQGGTGTPRIFKDRDLQIVFLVLRLQQTTLVASVVALFSLSRDPFYEHVVMTPSTIAFVFAFDLILSRTNRWLHDQPLQRRSVRLAFVEPLLQLRAERDRVADLCTAFAAG